MQSDILHPLRLFFANKNSIYKVILRHSPPTVEVIKTRPEGVNIKSLDIWGRDKIIWTESYVVEFLSEVRDRIVAMPKLGAWFSAFHLTNLVHLFAFVLIYLQAPLLLYV